MNIRGKDKLDNTMSMCECKWWKLSLFID